MKNYVTKALLFLTLLLSVAFLISSCAYGPKVEHKTPLDVLNGENYEASKEGPTTVVVPIVKRKERMTHIQGRLMTADVTMLSVPLRFVPIDLVSAKDEVLQQIRTENDGSFEFSAVMPNGDYLLRVESPKYFGQTKIAVNAYEIKNVLLKVSTKK